MWSWKAARAVHTCTCLILPTNATHRPSPRTTHLLCWLSFSFFCVLIFLASFFLFLFLYSHWWCRYFEANSPLLFLRLLLLLLLKFSFSQAHLFPRTLCLLCFRDKMVHKLDAASKSFKVSISGGFG